MSATVPRVNPYIAGSALVQQRGFVGRDDILFQVEIALRHTKQKTVVLFGQRRIGKTSILLQLKRRLSGSSFLIVDFDLMNRARRPLGQVLFELAATLADQAGMPVPPQEIFDDQGLYFRHIFLPNLYIALGEQCCPLLLFDELDVLDAVAAAPLSANATAKMFFAYLRDLLDAELRLKFVFVIGRRVEDLSTGVRSILKSALRLPVSVLDLEDTRTLITTAERQNSLCFTSEAVERITELTSGHPYFTQLLCQMIWDAAHIDSLVEVPLVDLKMVEMVVKRVPSAAQNVFESLWDDLPMIQQVILATIARYSENDSAIYEYQLLRLLKSFTVGVPNRKLKSSLKALIDRGILRNSEEGYKFFVEVIKYCVVEHKMPARVQMDFIYHRISVLFLRDVRAIAVDPLVDNIKASSEISIIDREKTDNRVAESEKAYHRDVAFDSGGHWVVMRRCSDKIWGTVDDMMKMSFLWFDLSREGTIFIMPLYAAFSVFVLSMYYYIAEVHGFDDIVLILLFVEALLVAPAVILIVRHAAPMVVGLMLLVAASMILIFGFVCMIVVFLFSIVRIVFEVIARLALNVFYIRNRA